MKIYKGNDAKKICGCDFAVDFPERKRIHLLQLTDMQIIDAEQRRTPERLTPSEVKAWATNTFDCNFGNHVKSLIAQTKPDFIFITGDMVYGEFDDSGRSLMKFCEFMDSFGIPWAPVFGNHDNESAKGVEWQCEILSKSGFCLFKRGNVSGNSNYTVGICKDGKLARVMYMLDSHGVLQPPGLRPDQIEFVRKSARDIFDKNKCKAPGFVAFHFPTHEFVYAETAKGYLADERRSYVIGVDVEAKDGDFGSRQENYKKISTVEVPGLMDMLTECNINGVFIGHYHSVCTCITYKNIKWVYGLKTGQYDYHTPGHLGGTLVTLENGDFTVARVPALVKYAPFVGSSPVYKDFFVKE